MIFELGESVEYRPQGGAAGVFIVMRRMPDDVSGLPVYRIKSGLEYCERNVGGSALTKLGSSLRANDDETSESRKFSLTWA
jgi:hypothetical protein